MLERIRQLCMERNITFAKLERECGLSNATIRRWKDVSPNVENLIKVANFFDVSLDYLVGNGVYSLSAEAQQYAKQFDDLPEDKKRLAIAYMSVVKAQYASLVHWFDDVDQNAWYAGDVNKAAELGIVEGVGGGKFDPDRPITRAEVTAMMVRLYDKLK